MNSTATNVAQISSPSTAAASFPFPLAFEISVVIYVYVGTLSVIVWDILNNLKADYILLTGRKIRLPTFVYSVSRLSTLAWLAMIVIFQTAPLGRCAGLATVMSGTLAVAISSTSLLFFLRVRGVYRDNTYVVFSFFFLWLAVCAGSLTTALTTTASTIGSSKYCTLVGFKSIVSLSGIVVVVNDTLVFLAISLRLMKCSLGNDSEWTVKGAIAKFFCGTDLPVFSKALLQGGQAYYLSTVGFSFATTVIAYIDSISPVYRMMLGSPNLMLMNVMACRVHRNMILGQYGDSTSVMARSISPITFGRHGTRAPLSSDIGVGPIQANLTINDGGDDVPSVPHTDRSTMV